ncbi:CheR family methyltransferase [Salinivirga cyanobacteriivorans]
MTETNTSFNNIELKAKEFERLSHYIFSNYGIKMPPAKKVMLQSRLQKRLRHLNINNFPAYIDFVFSKQGEKEIVHMMDVVSTNKTDFFREPTHFEFMHETILPEITQKGLNEFKIWSAGSSSGEEAYTIAMVIEEYIAQNRHINYNITGSDISTDMLQKAINGIYKLEKSMTIPESMKKKYLLKSKDPQKKLIRIKPNLRSKVSFFRLNLMDTSYKAPNNFDVIFCRNTLIYFERDTQEAVINRLCNHLKPNGYFILGHSESITNMDVPLTNIKPTIFRKTS